MKSLYENITDDEYSILNKILHNPGSSAADFFFDDPTIDGRVQELVEHKLVEFDSDDALCITELGRAALVEYDKIKKNRKSERRFQLMQFWIPTTISLAALIVSIIALLQ